MVTRVRVVVNGNLPAAGPERWSVGLNYGGGNVLSQAEAQGAAEDVAQICDQGAAGPLSALMTLLSTAATITDVDVYSYGPTGGAAAAGSAPLLAPKAGSGTPTCPPQVAAVLTLLTGFPGASRRGRIYWPALNPGLNSSLVSSTAQGVSDDLVGFAAAIQAALAVGGAYEFGVYSPKLNLVTPVTSVRAGNVLDTQRRRRDRMIESYSTSQYAT